MRIGQYRSVLAVAVATLALGLLAVMQLGKSEAASAASACTRLASSSGSDSAAGTPAAPWRTATKLLSSLQPGDVGCFAAGQTFGSASVEDMVAASDVTITSAPGGTPATLVGLLYLQGSRITVTGLRLDGHNSFSEASNPASVQGQAGIFVVGDDLKIVGNDISNGHTAICIGVGNPPAKPQRALIDGNRIHACGVLPQTHGEHGIYLGHGTNTTISNNLIYDIADFGIQLYPDATNTLVQNNIVSGTGEVGGIVIGAEGGTPSSGTTIRRNIITHTSGLAITTYWGGAVGSGNVATDNCTSDTAAQVPVAGLTVTSQKVVGDAGLDANFMLDPGVRLPRATALRRSSRAARFRRRPAGPAGGPEAARGRRLDDDSAAWRAGQPDGRSDRDGRQCGACRGKRARDHEPSHGRHRRGRASREHASRRFASPCAGRARRARGTRCASTRATGSPSRDARTRSSICARASTGSPCVSRARTARGPRASSPSARKPYGS